MPESYFEFLLQEREFRDQITDRVCDRILRQVVCRRLYPKHEFVFQWMWYFVSGENNVWIFQQLPVFLVMRIRVVSQCKKGDSGASNSHSDHVSQRMILLVDGKDGRMWDLSIFFNGDPVT